MIDKHFIRALTTAVVDYALAPTMTRLNDNRFKQGIILLNRYIDNSERHEVECLFAIQILINKLEHPSGKFEISIFLFIKISPINVLFTY